MDPNLVLKSHLLLLPAHTDPEDVAALVLTRHPEANVDHEIIDFGRHTRLHGPFLLDEKAFPELPPGRPMTYVLEAIQEREEPIDEVASTPDGLHRAFPHGLPIRAEMRAVELMLGLARRLDGVVWVHDSAVALQPHPQARINLEIFSPEWLDPDALLAAIQTRAPEAHLATQTPPWHGPPPDIVENPILDSGSTQVLPIALRRALHRACEEAERRALEQPVELDGYAIALDLDDIGLVEVRVHQVEVDINALRGFDWAADAISYEVVWHWHDMIEPDQENPSQEYQQARVYAAQAIKAIASCVVESTHGVVVDSDGFLVDRYHI